MKFFVKKIKYWIKESIVKSLGMLIGKTVFNLIYKIVMTITKNLWNTIVAIFK